MPSPKGRVRPLSLDEWFLSLQLDKIKDGFHLPITMSVDISHLVREYHQAHRKLSFTALLIKASSILIKERPECNKVFFKTFFGKKIVEPAYNAVNVPIEISINGVKAVSSAIIRDAHAKSLEQISSELKIECSRSLDELPVNKLIHGPGNYHLNKLKLYVIFLIFSNFPSIFLKKGGGGISVSSLFSVNRSNHELLIPAFGMTSFSICSVSVRKEAERTLLYLCVGFDHSINHGADGIRAMEHLVSILGRSHL